RERILDKPAARASARTKRRQPVASHIPQHIYKTSAVRVPQHVHSIWIGLILLLHSRESRIEKLDVTIAGLTGRLLPTVLLPFLISYADYPGNALHVYDNRFRPQLLNAKASRHIDRGPAVSVKHKHNRSVLARCMLRIGKYN